MQEYKVLVLEHEDDGADKKVYGATHVLRKMPDGKIKKIKDRWEYPTNKNKVTLYFPSTSPHKYSKEFFHNLSRSGVKSITLSPIDYEQALYEIRLECDASYNYGDISYGSYFSVFGVRVERELP